MTVRPTLSIHYGGRGAYIRSKAAAYLQLSVKDAFDKLTTKEKLYAHYMARAAWHGTRIIHRQVSPESGPIYDFIMEICRCSGGDWHSLARQARVEVTELEDFLDYAAALFAKVGNYYGTGDQKFIPRVSDAFLRAISTSSSMASQIYEVIAGPILARRPSSLGFPSDVAQSSYYPGEDRISRQEIKRVSEILEENSIYAENTRIRKVFIDGTPRFEVLQGSIESDESPRELRGSVSGSPVLLIRGDHSKELAKIIEYLGEACKYVANDHQKRFIEEYQRSFQTGNIETHKESQRIWVKDIKPAVETQFGFIEPYRDPFGIRAEFEGLVALVDAEETKLLTQLVENSAKFIRRLPWAEISNGENDGKGPFEKDLFEAPDFTSLHALAYCSSIIFPGINLPNYNDVRQSTGFKNVMISNRIKAENKAGPSPFISTADAPAFMKHKYHAYYYWVVLHELLGHGTGRMLTQDGPESFNFDPKNPPVNPLDGEPIRSWYRPGQTWTGLFGDIATTVDECRAELVGAYLMSDKELLELFGFTDNSEITADDLMYNLYLQLGVDGLRGLANYIEDDHKWGQAHSRAHFAMLKHLLRASPTFLTITHEPSTHTLTVHVDRSQILTVGKPALGAFLLRLHIYRCTADAAACRTFYEELSAVDGVFLEWRKIVLERREPKMGFVQANTFLEDDGKGGKMVMLREYEASVEGMVRSWAERDV